MLFARLLTKILSLKSSLKFSKVGFLGRNDGVMVIISGLVLNELDSITKKGPTRNKYSIKASINETTAHRIFFIFFSVFASMLYFFLTQCPDIEEEEYAAEDDHYIPVGCCLSEIS